MTQPIYTIVQLTDPHIRREADGVLLGMNTRHSFEAVLDSVYQQVPKPDAILLTGDVAQDGSLEAYQYVRDRLAGFGCPWYWFAGNHDDPAQMRLASDGLAALEAQCRLGDWHLVLLDSSVPGAVHGNLADDQLQILQDAVQQSSAKHLLVCLHHHPIDVGSRWIDGIGLKNREALFARLQPSERVRGLLWGHIHQEVDDVRDGLRLLATPSTCVQFKPRSADFAVDDLAPGFRVLHLHSDGRIDTEVHRVEHIDFEVDLSSKGY